VSPAAASRQAASRTIAPSRDAAGRRVISLRKANKREVQRYGEKLE
jgi:uncharacterized DUF497 family protein